MATITINKKAGFNYNLLQTFEAGVVLFGYETKAIRNQGMNINEAFVTIRSDSGNKIPEVFLTNAHIPLYRTAGIIPNYDPERPRKLLLHRKEVNSLIGYTKQKGLTLVPIKVYTKGTKIKVEFAVAQGKKMFDKKEKIKKRDLERDTRRTLREK